MIIEDYNTHLCHTQLCHTPSFTYNFVKHNFVTHHLSHAATLTPLCHTPSFTYHFVTHNFVTHLRFAWQAWYILFAWQAWHLWHWAGSGGALGLGRWSPVTPRYFAWQAWHLATSTFVLRGRCGAWWHLHSLYILFAWKAWHLWHWAGSGGALGRRWSPVTPRHFAWQAWHLHRLVARYPTQSFTHIIVSHTSFTHKFIAHNFSHTTFFNFSILHQLLCLSFLPRPATTFVSAYWKKLICGVIRSFIVFSLTQFWEWTTIHYCGLSQSSQENLIGACPLASSCKQYFPWPHCRRVHKAENSEISGRSNRMDDPFSFG